MNKQLRPADLSRPTSSRLRPSALPTIDRLTGRLFKALVAVIGLGLLGTLVVGVYRCVV